MREAANTEGEACAKGAEPCRILQFSGNGKLMACEGNHTAEKDRHQGGEWERAVGGSDYGQQLRKDTLGASCLAGKTWAIGWRGWDGRTAQVHNGLGFRNDEEEE